MVCNELHIAHCDFKLNVKDLQSVFQVIISKYWKHNMANNEFGKGSTPTWGLRLRMSGQKMSIDSNYQTQNIMGHLKPLDIVDFIRLCNHQQWGLQSQQASGEWILKPCMKHSLRKRNNWGFRTEKVIYWKTQLYFVKIKTTVSILQYFHSSQNHSAALGV